MTQNDLTQHSMKALTEHIKDYQQSRDLVSLVLDKNELNDEGVRELAHGLIERFNSMERDMSVLDFTTGQPHVLM